MGVIKITDEITIDESEITEEFTRSPGPGGQNVNKVATAVRLRFDVANSSSLPEDVRERVIRLGGRRITEDGVLIIHARRFRTQLRNRQDARERLISLVRKADSRPKRRRKTRPTQESRRRRLDGKRRRGEAKKLRKPVRSSDE